VTPSYFQTLRIKVLKGRALNDQDKAGAPPVMVVNETLAKRESNYFTGITPACEALEVIRRNCAINRFHCEGACESDRAPLRLFGGLGGVNYFSILMEAALSV